MWGFDEDYALKEKLSGFSVPNYANGTKPPVPIPVWFRFPDPEERTRTFPHIAIDLTTVEFAAERAHRAMEYIIDYDLEQATPLSGFTLVGDDFPLPWNLIYQLAAYTRSPIEDRYMQYMLYQMFPEQFGSLNMANFDGTVRRADLVSVVRRDTVDADNKRLYRNIFTISVSSEFFLNQIRTVQDNTSVSVETLAFINEPLPV